MATVSVKGWINAIKESKNGSKYFILAEQVSSEKRQYYICFTNLIVEETMNRLKMREGSYVLLSGRLDVGLYEKEDGTNSVNLAINIHNLEYCSSPKSKNSLKKESENNNNELPVKEESSFKKSNEKPPVKEESSKNATETVELTNDFSGLPF